MILKEKKEFVILRGCDGTASLSFHKCILLNKGKPTIDLESHHSALHSEIIGRGVQPQQLLTYEEERADVKVPPAKPDSGKFCDQRPRFFNR